ncbi:MAG TPA: lysylphosphatidylglycerol synthase transmembrane domain-containing protein, partial [Acidimicrobiia bacterium]|nr:lysylphosphatidylglycerol synthase transmembrane domain-containing protein [Acidimicrobiia bacterium]
MALPETGPTRRNARRLWLRMGVSAVLLAVLVVKISSEHIVPSHPTAGTLAFLVAGLLLMAGSFVLAAWRWQLVLAVFGAHVPLRTLFKHYLAGQFVGNVLPSTIGGDVLRITRSSKDVGARDVAFASVVLERLTGFVALPLLTVVGFVARPDLLHGRAWLAVVIAGSTVGVLFVIMLLAASPRLAGRFAEHENWMRYVGIVHVGVDRLRRDPRDACAALFAAISYQVAVIAAVYCAVHVIGLRIPNGAVLAFVPAVAIAQVLPISVGGLGVREGLLAFFFHALGVPT